MSIIYSPIKPGPDYIKITPDIERGFREIISDPAELKRWEQAFFKAVSKMIEESK
jgi:hypothetical protein